MGTSVQRGIRSRNGDSPTSKRRTRWSKVAAQLAGSTPGYMEKQVYGPSPIHQRLRAMVQACLKVHDHDTLRRLLVDLESDLVGSTQIQLAAQAAYIRRLRLALASNPEEITP